MHRPGRLPHLLALTILAVGAAVGQSHPDLSGAWRLNLDRSGPQLPRGTEALTMWIVHRDPFIHTWERRTVSGKVTESDSGTARIDGMAHVRRSAGTTTRVIQTWSGDVLTMDWTMTDRGVTYRSRIRTSLSSDGSILTMAEHYQEPGMERIRNWVFERQ